MIEIDIAPQDALDQAYEFLWNQNCRSVTESGEGEELCMYRGRNGTKCGFGLFIPDDKYTPQMEHKSVDDLINVMQVIKLGPKSDINIFSSIQVSHDCCSDHKDGPYSFRAILNSSFAKTAERFGLMFTPKQV